MSKWLRTRLLLCLLLPGAVYLSAPGLPPAIAQVSLFNNPANTLPVQERVTLRQERPVVSGVAAIFTAHILSDCITC